MARILIVEDDDAVREATRMVLESEGHDITEARDGATAMKAHRNRQADIIICDMYMPGQDGIETLRKLRREFPAVKVIAVSGGGYLGTMEVLTIARHIGAAAALTKPFTRARLLAEIERLEKG